MNTTQLKSFAAEARKSLLSGVKSKMNALGFKDNGSIDERDYPMQAADGTLFQGEIYDVSFYGKWMRLKDEIVRYGFRQVCEEGAYTWFNRLMAIQILSRNGLIDPVLEFESPDVRIPLMVKQAHEGIRPEMTAFDATRLNAVIDDDNRITDQFAILIVAYCQSTPILYKCFGTLNDFTELLLPTNILASNGFLNLLNGSTFISQDDYETTELIGWLYQFYISERKDEVFASFKSGHKADANDIPAATQIFTPNWIVKYMVQNTLGRIYLDNNPASTLKDSWQYLVDVPLSEGVAEGRGSQSRVPRLEVSCLENLTFADLSCGSGHILGEAFDMLFALYKEEGYNRRQAIKAIFEHNLTGVDIDTRARQLATFALMLKACQQWPDAINCEVMPRVYDMPSPDDPVCERYPILKQANNLGSIMKIEALPNETHPLVLALTQKYAAITSNPPYMGRGNMNAELAAYLNDNYPDSKQDLFSVFIQMMIDHTIDNGKTAFITMESWMFLSSFEKFRKAIVDNYQIDSLSHFGWHIIGIAFGTAMTVLTKSKPIGQKGEYSYLTIDDVDKIKNMPLVFPKKDNGRYAIVDQSSFKKIPGCPIGYWVSEKLIKAFENRNLSSICETRCGLATGRNDLFLRLWYEIDFRKIGFGLSRNEAKESAFKWFPYDKAGGFRKWYGNRDYVLDWFNDGYELQNTMHPDGKRIWAHNFNLDKIFLPHIGWSDVINSDSELSFRYFERGFNFDGSANAAFAKPQYEKLLLGFANSKIVAQVRDILNPTIHFKPGNFLDLPFHVIPINDDLIDENISISKQDWDAHETSWDFQENELVRVFKEGKAKDLQAAVSAYKEEWEEKFNQLHDNEEELNRQFIEIYGLQEELTPEVPLEEVTILQQGEISIEDK